jgi:hypothetical protein
METFRELGGNIKNPKFLIKFIYSKITSKSSLEPNPIQGTHKLWNSCSRKFETTPKNGKFLIF